MKCIYAVSLLLTLSVFSIAQPVITREDVVFPGDDFRISSTMTIPSQGSSGPNVTWNFGSVMPAASTTILVDEADDTPYADNYPGSNIALVDMTPGSQFYQYYNLDNDIWEELGNISPQGAPPTQVTYNDPRTYMQFPVAYNGQWQDSYTYTINYGTVPPITTFGEGSFNALVDGYGTLILPQATFTDVLRLRLIGSSTDTTELGMGLYERNNFSDTTYIWLSPSYHSPLATHFSGFATRITWVIFSGDTMAFPESIGYGSFTYDPQAEPTSALKDVVPGLHRLEITPNPFSESMDVVFNVKESGDVHFRLTDLYGNVVLEEKMHASAGENKISLQPQNIIPGSYVATLQSDEGMDIQPIVHIELRQ